MKDREYALLKKMLEKNRNLYKAGRIEFEEYLENHMIITKQLKSSIISMEQVGMIRLAILDDETCLGRFKQGVMMLKVELN